MRAPGEPDWIGKALADLRQEISMNSARWDAELLTIATDAERTLSVFKARLDGDTHTPEAD